MKFKGKSGMMRLHKEFKYGKNFTLVPIIFSKSYTTKNSCNSLLQFNHESKIYRNPDVNLDP